MIIRLVDITLLYYLTGLLCFALYFIFPGIFKDLALHGKTLNDSQKWHVSKRYFTSFYALGVVMALALFRLEKGQELLLLAHLLRRLGESILWPYSSRSLMHPIHLLVGLSYYPILVLSFIQTATQFTTHTWQVCFFILLNVLQAFLHWRLWRAGQAKDYLPLSDLEWPFRYTLSPHYYVEMFIYLLFAQMSGWTLLLTLNLVFVMANLLITVLNTREWYLQRFPKAMNRPLL